MRGAGRRRLAFLVLLGFATAGPALSQGYGRGYDRGPDYEADSDDVPRRERRPSYEDRRTDRPDYDASPRGYDRPDYDTRPRGDDRRGRRDDVDDLDDRRRGRNVPDDGGYGRSRQPAESGRPSPRGRGSEEAQLPPTAGMALYVGSQQGCNAGVVTNSSRHLNCATTPIGSTVGRERSGGGAPIYVGTTAGLNAGVVTTASNHLGGRTREIGYLLRSGGRQRLYVGTQPGCNAGIVTTSSNHLNCSTQEIGSTAP